jgi:hypothetical protein
LAIDNEASALREMAAHCSDDAHTIAARESENVSLLAVDHQLTPTRGREST